MAPLSQLEEWSQKCTAGFTVTGNLVIMEVLLVVPGHVVVNYEVDSESDHNVYREEESNWKLIYRYID